MARLRRVLKVGSLTLLGLLLLLALAFTATLLWMTSVPGRSHEGPLPALTPVEMDLAQRLERHVRGVASEPHNFAHPAAMERSALYIENSLAGLGYRVRSQRFKADGRRLLQAGGYDVPDLPPEAGEQIFRNIEAVIEPASQTAPTLVVGAHYDSNWKTPGANDNGSGTAALLELARLLADLKGRADIRIRLVLFANEEPPFFQKPQMGSLVYARALQRTKEPVIGMISLETIGYYSEAANSQHYPPPLGLIYPTTGDFVAFVGLTSSRPFVRETVRSFREIARFPSVGGTAPGSIPGIDWSDHWSFEQIGVPALMVTDTAIFRYPHYHKPTDTPDKLDYAKLARVVSGLERVIRRRVRAES
jgi:hypothetical protein